MADRLGARPLDDFRRMFLRRRVPDVQTRVRPQAKVLRASAALVNTADDKEAHRFLMRRQDWQSVVFDYYHAVGEAHDAIGQIADAMSNLRLFVGEVDPLEPDKEPTPSTDARANAALERLRASDTGFAELLKSATVQLEVPGEGFLIGLGALQGTELGRGTGGEDWQVRSLDEVKPQAGSWLLLDQPGNISEARKLGPEDFVLRFWNRDAQFRALADSPMHGVMAPLEEILIIDRAKRAEGRSRAAGAGLLMMPEELSFGNADPTTDNAGDGEDTDDPFLEDLIKSMTTPLSREDDSSALVPLILQGRSDILDKVRHIFLGRNPDAALNAWFETALKRFSMGINMPPEAISGLGDSNHWSAWLIDDRSFKSYLKPQAQALCSMWTTGYLWPALMSMGRSADQARKFVIWYDPANLVVSPNRAQDARDAMDKDAISFEAYRRVLDFDEDDAPSNEELLMRVALRRGILDPAIQDAIIQTIVPGLVIPKEPSPDAPIPAPVEPAPQPSEQLPKGPPASGPPQGGGPQTPPTKSSALDKIDLRLARAIIAAGPPPLSHKHLGRKMLSIDQALRGRLLTAADAAMRRALERAGAKLRTKAQRSKIKGQVASALKGVDNIRTAAVLGPQLVATILNPRDGMSAAAGGAERDLLDGSFDELRHNFDAWVEQAQRQALGHIPNLSEQDRQELMATQDGDRRDAWELFKAGLLERALKALYDPTAEVPEKGEYDATMLVQNGLVRDTLDRAGGGLRTAVEAGRYRSGIGNGPVVVDALKRFGKLEQKSYTWDYGAFPRTSPFEPHVALDGYSFEHFDDPGLANAEGWPEGDHYFAGDHEGCGCDIAVDYEAIDEDVAA